MLDVFKMDLKRSLHRKGFIIMLIICIALAIGCMFISKVALQEDTNGEIFKFYEVFNFLFDVPLFMILFTFFITSFIVEDFNNGFIKNIVSYTNDKAKYFTSKIVSISIILFALMFMLTVVMLIAGIILAPTLDYTNIMTLLSTFILHYFLFLVCSAMIASLSILLRNVMVSSWISVIYLIGAPIIYSEIEKHIPIHLTKYALSCHMSSIGNNLKSWVSLCIIGMIYFIFSIIVGRFIMRKKDIH